MQSKNDKIDNFPELDGEIDKLLQGILSDVLVQAQSELEDNKPNPSILLKCLGPEMIKYLKKYSTKSEAFYLLLFNSSIQSIVQQLEKGIMNTNTLNLCLNAPGSKDYLSRHPGMQFSIDLIKERLLTENPLSVPISNPLPNSPVISPEKEASLKKHPRFFAQISPRGKMPVQLSKEEQLQKSFASWEKDNSINANNIIRRYKQLLNINESQYLQMGISQHFIDILKLQLDSLSVCIDTINKIPELFFKELGPNDEAWIEGLDLLKEYQKKELEAQKCIHFMNNLNTIFITQDVTLSPEYEKLLTTASQAGIIYKDFYAQNKLYLTYKESILKDKIILEYRKKNHKIFDYFIIELQRWVNIYDCKKDKIKLGLGGLEPEKTKLAENLALLWEIYSLNILPLLMHIEGPIKIDPDEVLSASNQKIYADDLLPKIDKMKTECLHYQIMAKEMHITPEKEDVPQASTDLMLLKIKQHHAYFELIPHLKKHQKEEAKLNVKMKNNLQILLDVSEKIIKKEVKNSSQPRWKSVVLEAPKKSYQHKKALSDPGVESLSLGIFSEMESKITATKLSNDTNNIEALFIDVYPSFKKYAAIKDKLISLLVAIEKNYKPLTITNLQNLEIQLASLQGYYKEIKPKFEQIRAKVRDHLRAHKIPGPLFNETEINEKTVLALRNIISGPYKYLHCEKNFSQISSEFQNFGIRIDALKMRLRNLPAEDSEETSLLSQGFSSLSL